VRIDSAALPFVLAAALPAAVAALAGATTAAIALVMLPGLIALFFRDPERSPPVDPAAILAPADGKVTHAGPARPDEAPPGHWLQVTIFLSLFDVHINRTAVPGKVTRVDLKRGLFLPAYRTDAWRNEHSEIWIEWKGRTIVYRQVVGVLARRVVCRVRAGDVLETGARIGLMKFGSRMDVFMPPDAMLQVRSGEHVRGGETVIARLASE
jgi:phosphatidylserine decarboxylase